MSFIDVKGVTKNYGATAALKNVSLKFEENRICGLLGRNGAGKTTLINLITNKIFPTCGEIQIDGEDIIENDAALSKIYCMSESNLYPDNMRIKDIFKWSKTFYPELNMDYAEKLADKFRLPQKKKVRELSTGYVSIFKLVVALSSNAPILLLDEPVLGLDANFRDLFYRELLANYSEKPRTIVISTHLIEEAAEIIEDVVIIKNGEILIKDTVQNLISRGYTVTGPQRLIDSFIQGKNVLGIDILGGIKSAYLLEALDKSTVPEGIEVSGMKLQNLFIHLTNV